MTRDDMIDFIRENPHVRISHKLFSDNEYIYSDENGIVYDESGYIFEDWKSIHKSDGIRIRCCGNWESGWFVKDFLRRTI